jgi:hypothetical protein
VQAGERRDEVPRQGDQVADGGNQQCRAQPRRFGEDAAEERAPSGTAP